jgi:hypothetical protein
MGSGFSVLSCLVVTERVSDIPVQGAALAQALALRDRLDAAISEALGAFDDAAQWALDSCHSLTDWLRSKGRCSGGEAARAAATARRCRRLPVTAEAWRSGGLPSAQVRVITSHVGDRRVGTFGRRRRRGRSRPDAAAGCADGPGDRGRHAGVEAAGGAG